MDKYNKVTPTLLTEYVREAILPLKRGESPFDMDNAQESNVEKDSHKVDEDGHQQLERHGQHVWTDSSLTYPAMEIEGEYYSSFEVGQKVLHYQSQLLAQGIQAEQVVMVVCRYQPQVVWFYLAMLSIGAISAFVAPQSQVQLASKAKALFAKEGVKWIWSPDEQLLPATTSFSVLVIEDGGVKSSLSPILSTRADAAHTRVASLVFTSGSTGLAKAVAHSLAQHLDCAQAVNQALRCDSTSRWLVTLPFYHVSGLALIHRSLMANATLVFGRDWPCYLSGCSHVSLVATQLFDLLSAQPGLDTLPCVLLGGSATPQSLLPLLTERGLQEKVWLGYGMTETASTVTLGRLENTGTSGQPLMRRAVRIVDDVIEIKSPSLAMGYYDQGQLQPWSVHHTWWQTSDLGCWQRNKLKVLGRRDNAFISGGENIHCEEIERALLNHPDIERVMVFAIADEHYGARPVAVYSGAVGDAPCVDLEQITLWLMSYLEKYKCPDRYVVMPDWAVNWPVKIPRYRLKAWLKENYPDWDVL